MKKHRAVRVLGISPSREPRKSLRLLWTVFCSLALLDAAFAYGTWWLLGLYFGAAVYVGLLARAEHLALKAERQERKDQ